MKLASVIINELISKGDVAYISRESARRIYMKQGAGALIHIATSAPLSKIREACKTLGVSCRIHSKINKTTTELIVNGRYIIEPFIKTIIKNNYATRKYSSKEQDYIDSRDITINALLYDVNKQVFIDTVGAFADFKNKLIKAVGDPHVKINENRLFMLDVGIVLAELGPEWSLEFKTYEAITQHSLEIAIVSAEAIKKSFTYLIKNTDKPSLAFRYFKNTNLLAELMPEMLHSVNLPQSNKSNNLDLFNHIMYALDSVSTNKPNYEALRWAAIFHDIAKPYTKSFDKKGNVHFYGHDKIGAIFSTRWLEKNKFPAQLINKVATLCRHHLFDASLRLDNAAIQRLITRVGETHILDLINLREADRWGTGRKNISMRNINILRDRIKKILKSP